jgi:hypothetical protein
VPPHVPPPPAVAAPIAPIANESVAAESDVLLFTCERPRSCTAWVEQAPAPSYGPSNVVVFVGGDEPNAPARVELPCPRMLGAHIASEPARSVLEVECLDAGRGPGVFVERFALAPGSAVRLPERRGILQ